MPVTRFLTRSEDLTERLLDPVRGLALVETGADVHTVLQTIERDVDGILDNDPTEATWDLGYAGLDDGGNFGDYFSEQKPAMEAARLAVNELFSDCALTLAPTVSHPRYGSLLVVAQRRSQLTPNHNDYTVVTAWLGATRPGLKVLHGDEWVTVDDVPTGHVLFWRGQLASASGNRLEPTKHYAKYRSTTRRIIMLASASA